MKSQEFQDKMNAIQEKIGEEASGLIIDEIGLLLTDNKNVNNELQEKDKEIEKLKARNESLMNVINNLYDLNLTYDVANGGTLYRQILRLGSTNLAKLTSDEIAIATNKGWDVI